MNSEKMYLRCAEMKDSQLIFEWRNDIGTRMNSLNMELISYDTHCKWLETKLQSQNCQMYVCMENDKAIGQIRVDYIDGKGEISYTVAPEYRGKGYGKKIIELLEEKEATKKIVLFGIVKSNNVASQKCFEKLGYNKENDGDIIRYSKNL